MLLTLINIPTEAPFRIDQVMTDPLLLGTLFTIQLLLASLLNWIGATGHRYFWWTISLLWLAVTTVFFALACWGTSDITKLNHYLAEDPMLYLPGEPFWWWLSNLIVHLPYRMASVHGIIAASYGSVGLFLAHQWRIPAWGGWWALLITTSPTLRGFLQNAHSRQALATLLALPLMLYLADLMRIRLWLLLSASLLAPLVHNTALLSLLFGALNALPWPRAIRYSIRDYRSWLNPLLLLVLILLLTATALIIGPALLQKTEVYFQGNSFFSSYAIRRQVLQGQFVLLASLSWACWHRGLSWQALIGCSYSRRLTLNIALYSLLQLSVSWQVFPQISFRLSDMQAFFLLVSLLAWLRAHRITIALVPLLAINLISWGDQIWASERLNCGQDDGFFCVPNRGPNVVQYT